MGCCLAKEDVSAPLLDPDPRDPLEVKFNDLYVRGGLDDYIPTSVIARTMGIPSITMGRMVTQWGYTVGRKYVGGKRLRVVLGIKGFSYGSINYIVM